MNRQGLRKWRWRQQLDSAATMAVIVLCVAVVWALVFQAPASTRVDSAKPTSRPDPPKLPTTPVSIAGAARHGSDGARVALIAYSDLQCPYCGVFARETLPSIMTKYVDTGKVMFVFRHFPLDGLHPFAREAAEAVECGARQEKFLPLHDAMFANQASLNRARVDAHIAAVGLDAEKFARCMSGESRMRVEEDVASGRALGVTGTPTVFVGLVQADRRVKLVQRISGARPVADFERVLDRSVSVTDGR